MDLYSPHWWNAAAREMMINALKIYYLTASAVPDDRLRKRAQASEHSG
jgi:hypothetical protein